MYRKTKHIILLLASLACGQALQAQSTVVTVHTTGGAQTSCTLGPTGAIYFTAQGEQIAVKEETGIVRGFGLGMVEKVTFAEKADEGIAPGESPRLKAYPNPVGNLLYVESTASQAEVVDLQGRVVLRADLPVLHLQSLPAGLYFLRCDGQTLKIVKQ